jgi:hypothetical protein
LVTVKHTAVDRLRQVRLELSRVRRQRTVVCLGEFTERIRH